MSEVKVGDMVIYKERYETFLAVVVGYPKSVPNAFHVRQIGSSGMQTIVLSQIIKKVEGDS